MLLDLTASPRRHSSPRRRFTFACLIAMTLVTATGCTSLFTPITGIPASQLPDELLGIRRSDFVSVPVVMLARKQDDNYLLDKGDIVGIYIDGILPFSTPSSVPIPPPVNYSDANSNVPPSIGYPIPVQEGGIINLPLLKPFSVRGMTVAELRDEISKQYHEKDFLRSEESYPVVSLISKRQNSVTVIRSNTGAAIGADGTAAGYTLKLDADRNDVLTALTQSGGLPGFNEKNELVIFKTSRMPAHLRSEIMAQLMSQGGATGGCGLNGMPAGAGISMNGLSPEHLMIDDGMIENDTTKDKWVVRIPLRVPPGNFPHIPQSDIILDDGDILYVESRETELYYTGGLLQNGQHPIPRDYDLDVVGAIALAGKTIGSREGGGGGGGLGGVQALGGPSPTLLYIIRKMPCGRTFNIIVDLQVAVNNSHENILVQPGDTLILRYKPHEELLNFGIGTFFTYGISQLLNGGNNNRN